MHGTPGLLRITAPLCYTVHERTLISNLPCSYSGLKNGFGHLKQEEEATETPTVCLLQPQHILVSRNRHVLKGSQTVLIAYRENHAGVRDGSSLVVRGACSCHVERRMTQHTDSQHSCSHEI